MLISRIFFRVKAAKLALQFKGLTSQIMKAFEFFRFISNTMHYIRKNPFN